MPNASLERQFLQKSIKPKVEKDLNVLSLFSGCGGMDLGFEGHFEVHNSCINKKINRDWEISKGAKLGWVKLPPTRFQTIFANDIRKGAKNVWASFFKENFHRDSNCFYLESIVDRVKRHWDGEKNLFPKNVDLVTGGFPCQDFSVSGKRYGFSSHKNHVGNLLKNPTEENRGKLYIWMREVIDIVRPKVFIAENVKGLVSLGDASSIIQNDFMDIGSNGYIVLNGKVLNSAEYGIPQSRERVFFIGFRRDALNKVVIRKLLNKDFSKDFSPFPQKTHSKTATKNLLPFVPLKNILKDLKEPSNTKDDDQKSFSKAKWYGKHCQGNTEVNINTIGPTIRSEHHGNIEFRRLKKNHGGLNYEELKKGLPERRLTIRECCRIQTFPDNYSFLSSIKNEGVSCSEAYKLIGNAVPPLLGFHLAKSLENIWSELFK